MEFGRSVVRSWWIAAAVLGRRQKHSVSGEERLVGTLNVWLMLLMIGSAFFALVVGVPLFVCSSTVLYLLARALRIRKENATLVALLGAIGVIMSLNIVLLLLLVVLGLSL